MFLWVTSTCAWMLEDSAEPPEGGVTPVVSLWELNLDLWVPAAEIVLNGFLTCFRGLSYWRGGFGMAGGVVYSIALGVLCKRGWHAQCAWCNLRQKRKLFRWDGKQHCWVLLCNGKGAWHNSPTHFHHFIFLMENHLAVVIDYGSLGTCNFFLCADNQRKEIKEAKKN